MVYFVEWGFKEIFNNERLKGLNLDLGCKYGGDVVKSKILTFRLRLSFGVGGFLDKTTFLPSVIFEVKFNFKR